MRLALVVNSGSGGGTDADALTALLEGQGADVRTHPFDDLDAIALDDVDRLVVATGDGGLGAAAARAADAGIPLAVLPSGTANDFAAALDLPNDPGIAAVLAARADARTRGLDVAWAGGTPFLNAASCGLAVAAAEHADGLKQVLGAAAYAAGAARAAASHPACDYRVLVDGDERFAGPAWQVIVSGTGAFGNGSEIEEADPADGRLDVTVIRGGSRLALPLRAWGLRRGGLHEQDGVEHLQGREVVVEGADSWNVDGEVCDLPDAGRFRLDGRVAVVVPD